jgi:hypothetical protein
MADTMHTNTTPVFEHPSLAPPLVTYEQRLSQNRSWALDEGFRYFQGMSAPQDTLRRIAQRLNELGIPYAVAGGMALFHHGFRRFTEDVDILVTREGLKAIHERLEGLGYVRPFEHSKNLRDTETGVRIEFLIAGDYPGDGKPKPVAFPDPAHSAERDGDISFLPLHAFVELKLASGISSTARRKDLVDVESLIRDGRLSLDLATQLNPYVQSTFLSLWQLVHGERIRYLTVWRHPPLAAPLRSLDGAIAQLQDSRLSELRGQGVVLEPLSPPRNDRFLLVTSDAEIAAKYGMTPESEFWMKDLEDEGMSNQ